MTLLVFDVWEFCGKQQSYSSANGSAEELQLLLKYLAFSGYSIL